MVAVACFLPGRAKDLSAHPRTVKPVGNGTAMDQIVSVAGRSPLMQVLEVWILGPADSLDCKIVPVKKGSRYSQVPFKTGFTVRVCNYNWSHPNCQCMMICS